LKRLDEKTELFHSEIRAELESLKNEIKAEIKRIDDKLEIYRSEAHAFQNEFRAEIKRLDEKIEVAIQIRERLAVLEQKVEALTKQ
jgi:uncharacterized protein involved in exopolysaccharide biosynthesis